MNMNTTPVPDVTSEPYWEAARQRKLMIQRCPVTGRHQWYPRDHSLYVPGAKPEWVAATGRGKVFTYSVIHRGHDGTPTPYVCAVIELEEGVLFTATLKGVAHEKIDIGMPVEVDFEMASDGISLPFFKPADKQ